MTLSPQLADDMNVRALALGHTILSGTSQFYADGFWHTDNESAWWLELGAAQLAASMYRYVTPVTPIYRDVAVDTVERAIKYNLYGSAATNAMRFAAGYEGTLDPSNDDTCTIEVIASIGWIMQMLGDALDPGTRRRWLTILKNCCNWLEANGNVAYYINGNFAAHLCLAFYTVAELCRSLGDEAGYQRHAALYERAYTTMVTPSTNDPVVWAGYGYVIDVAGAQWDRSDETGHLTETNGYVGPNPTPTWDPYYTTLTLDILARLYLLKRDHRIMRLINALHNKLEPLINTTSWVINCTGGSRTNFNQGYVMCWLQMVPLVGLRALSRTIFSSVNCTGSWDTQTIGSLSANLTVALVAPATQRQWGLCIGSMLHIANTANKQIT